MGWLRSRVVPRARPNRELAPSATTTYRARTVRTAPEAFSLTTAPTHDGRPAGPEAPIPSRRPGAGSARTGSTASVPCHTVAPALTARSLTRASRSWRVITYP